MSAVAVAPGETGRVCVCAALAGAARYCCVAPGLLNTTFKM